MRSCTLTSSCDSNASLFSCSLLLKSKNSSLLQPNLELTKVQVPQRSPWKSHTSKDLQPVVLLLWTPRTRKRRKRESLVDFSRRERRIPKQDPTATEEDCDPLQLRKRRPPSKSNQMIRFVFLKIRVIIQSLHFIAVKGTCSCPLNLDILFSQLDYISFCPLRRHAGPCSCTSREALKYIPTLLNRHPVSLNLTCSNQYCNH